MVATSAREGEPSATPGAQLMPWLVFSCLRAYSLDSLAFGPASTAQCLQPSAFSSVPPPSQLPVHVLLSRALHAPLRYHPLVLLSRPSASLALPCGLVHPLTAFIPCCSQFSAPSLLTCGPCCCGAPQVGFLVLPACLPACLLRALRDCLTTPAMACICAFHPSACIHCTSAQPGPRVRSRQLSPQPQWFRDVSILVSFGLWPLVPLQSHGNLAWMVRRRGRQSFH